MVSKLSVHADPDILFAVIQRELSLDDVRIHYTPWTSTNGALFWVLDKMVRTMYEDRVFKTSANISLSKWWVSPEARPAAIEDECVVIMQEFRERFVSNGKHKLQLFAFPAKGNADIDLFLYLL